MPSLFGPTDPPEIQHGNGEARVGAKAAEVGLRLAPPPHQIYNKELVAWLEDWVARVKTGEIEFVLVVASSPCGDIWSAWKGAKRPFSILGGLWDVMMRFREKEIERD